EPLELREVLDRLDLLAEREAGLLHLARHDRLSSVVDHPYGPPGVGAGAGGGVAGFGGGVAGAAGVAGFTGAGVAGFGGAGGPPTGRSRPSFTSNPAFGIISIASTGQTIAHFSQPTQLSTMMIALRETYDIAGRANFRSAMSIASNAQLSKQCVHPMHTSSSTTAVVPRPRMYCWVRNRNSVLYRFSARSMFICRVVR